MDNRVPDGWQRLTCVCGTQRFSPVTHLRWRKGGGITSEPGGYFCLECHAVVDSATLIHRAELQLKREELREMEAELADVGAAPSVPKSAKPKEKGTSTSTSPAT